LTLRLLGDINTVKMNQMPVSEHKEELSERQSLVRDRLLSWVRSTEAYYDQYGVGFFCLLMGLFSALAWVGSQGKPLWFDELLGLAAATAPRLQSVYAALAKPVDINPPLYHLVTRLSVSVLGYSASAARLPAFLGILVFLTCLFVFISRRLSPSYGVLGALLVLCTQVSEYAWESRPYGMILGLTGLAMLSYQRRIEKRTLTPLIVFCLVCCCLPLTHYYGILVVGPFLAAEAARGFERKQIDWPLVVVAVLAPSVALFALHGLIHSQKAILSHYHSLGFMAYFTSGFDLTVNLPSWAIWLGIVILVLGSWLASGERDPGTGRIRSEFTAPELVLAASLLSLPFLGAIIGTFTHAYASRYFIAASAGYAILICYLAASFRPRCAGVALLLSIVATTTIIYDLVHAIKHRHDAQPLASIQSVLDHLELPIIFQDPKDYVLARELYPISSSRFYYAAEPELSIKVIGTDNDDKLMLALASLQPEQLSRLDDMNRKSEYWILVPSSVGWLLPCLTTMRAEVEPISIPGDPPKSAFSGFKVRFPAPVSRPVLWCEAVSRAVR
jgi:hypothetical protein